MLIQQTSTATTIQTNITWLSCRRTPTSRSVAMTADYPFTTNVLEANQTWTSLNNGYQTTQFFTIAIDPEPTSATQNSLLGGMQDNGTYSTDAFNPTAPWEDIFGGDGSFAAIVPGGETIYASAQEGFVFRFQGNTFTNVAPAGGNNFLFITLSCWTPTTRMSCTSRRETRYGVITT